ncbi:MAG: AI-2E family transporter [bacterium]|nr:AI-2E family transporter [bacterium]
MPRKVEISHKTIVFTVLFLLALWLVFQLRQIILVVFVAVILMSALNPTVDRLEKTRLPRWLAILFLYILLFAGFGLALSSIIPPLVDQTGNFVNRIILYLREVNLFGIDFKTSIPQLSSQIGLLSSDILRVTVGIFSNLTSLFFVLVVTFYLLLERKKLDRYLLVLFGEGGEKKADEFVDKIENRLGSWVRGQLILMTIIGVMTYIGLRLLGIEFALPLAILAAFLELVPTIGPVVSAIPAILVALTISPVMALAVTALYFLIQQLEGSVIAPKIMQKAVGVNPLMVILSLAVGFKLAGVAGAVLAVPIVLVLQVIVSEMSFWDRFKKL